MSIKAIAWALDQKTGSPTSKLVLIKLADNANDTGFCWPSLATIAKHTELSKETVSRHIKRLESARLISVHRRMKDGVNLPNNYHLEMRGVSSEDQGGIDPARSGVPSEDQTEPSVEPSKNSKGKRTANKVEKPDAVEDQTWSDFLENRRAKKAPLTLTAWKTISRELAKGEKQGHLMDDMLAEAVTAGWQGFRLDWYLNRIKGSGSRGDQSEPNPPSRRELN